MRKLKKTLKWVGIVAGVLVVVYVGLNLVAGAQLRAKIRELKAAGYPVTLAEIQPASVPTDQNAAVPFVKALGLMTSGRGPKVYPQSQELGSTFAKIDEFSASTNRLNPSTEQAAELTSLLETPDVKQVCDLLEQAAQRPGYNMDLDYTQGPGILLPHLGLARKSARLLAAKATLQSRAGDVEGAMHSLLVGLKDANHLKNEPILISQLVRYACERVLLESLENVADGTNVPPSQAALLLDELTGHVDSEPLARALDVERVVFGQWFIERLMGGRYSELLDNFRAVNGGEAPRAAALSLAGPFLKWDIVTYMDLCAEQSRLLREPSDVAYRSIALGPDSEHRIPWYCLLTRTVLPSFQAVCKTHVEQLARLETCRAGLAVKLYRQKHGTYPDGLAKVVPEFLAQPPRDPFTGQALHYRTVDKGFVVYSVGRDLKDDGGKRLPLAAQGIQPSDDVVWESRG